MRKDENGNWIGAGEDAAYEIFCKWFGKDNVARTVPLKKFKVEVPWGLSERQQKETIDLVFKQGIWTFLVRIQDSRHKGQGLARIDRIQQELLEAIPYHKVINIHEGDAAVLFRDEVNEESEFEIWLNFLDQFVLICPSCHTIGRAENLGGEVFCDACGEKIEIKLEFLQ